MSSSTTRRAHHWRGAVWMLVATATAGTFSFAQPPDRDPLGGASRPRPVPNGPAPADGQSKRIGQWALTLILQGKHDEAVSYLQRMAEKRDDDGELHFLLALAHTHLDQPDEAEAAIGEAIELGLPPQRFLAGPRELLEPLRETAAWKDLEDRFADGLLHGPMVGSLTDRSARVWVRTGRRSVVRVVTGESSDSLDIHSETVETGPESDFTAVVDLEGLQPRTEYQYRVLVDDQPQELQSFRTFPAAGSPSRFNIAFGGGAGYVLKNERIWTTIASLEPDALLLLGDNVYSDNPETPPMQRYCYYRRQSRPEFRSLVGRTPVFAIWDDHDFSTDDSWGGPHIDVPAWKRPVWNVFRHNWVNPSYGGGEEQPGVWYDFVIGDVHFIMLDGRYYRTDSGRRGGDGAENPTMLGLTQKEWLKETLAGSAGTFKVLVSPVPWDLRAKPGQAGLDTWRGYAEEREEIFSFIEANHIEGVVLASADRHRSDAWQIERDGGYDLYEFNSSRLTNEHVHSEMEEAVFSYNKKQSFGRITFDTEANDPTVTYDVITIDGETVHSLKVPLSRLR